MDTNETHDSVNAASAGSELVLSEAPVLNSAMVGLPPSGGAGFAKLRQITMHPDNARTVYPPLTAQSEVEFRASLMELGVIEPLVVVELGDGLGALAGERRRRNLFYMAEVEKRIDLDQNIPIIQRDKEDHADRVSHAENHNRLPMKAWETFVHIAQRAKDGQSVEDIAKAMGQLVKNVRWLLRLGNLHRSIFTALKKGEITLEVAQAYALTEDVKKQKRIWGAVGKTGMAWKVREEVRRDSVDSASAVARFVTLDAYCKAGGPVAEELLDDKVAILDVELLHELAEKKLEEAAQSVGKGWAWMEVGLPESISHSLYYQCVIKSDTSGVPKKVLARKKSVEKKMSTINKWLDEWYDDHESESEHEARDLLESKDHELAQLRSELETIEQRTLTEYTVFEEYAKEYSGCIVSFDHEGALSIKAGVLRDSKSEKNYRRAVQISESGGDPSTVDVESKADATNKNEEQGRSAAFARDIGLYVRADLRVGIAEDVVLARDMLDYHLVSKALSEGTRDSYTAGFLSWSGGLVSDTRERPEGDVCEAERRLAALRDALPVKWFSEADPSKQFTAFQKLKEQERASLIAWVVASRLDVGHEVGGVGGLPEVIKAAIQVDHTALWRPTAETYFNRCDLGTLIAHGVEWYGKAFNEEVDKMKGARKKQLAQRFANLFTGDESVLSDKEKKIRATWLPVEFQG